MSEDRISGVEFGYEANSVAASMMVLYVEEAIRIELLKREVERIVNDE